MVKSSLNLKDWGVCVCVCVFEANCLKDLMTKKTPQKQIQQEPHKGFFLMK
jgi:hypothetical protein